MPSRQKDRRAIRQKRQMGQGLAHQKELRASGLSPDPCSETNKLSFGFLF
jgi:hypothetical protein